MVGVSTLKMCFIVSHHVLQVLGAYKTLLVLIETIEHYMKSATFLCSVADCGVATGFSTSRPHSVIANEL